MEERETGGLRGLPAVSIHHTHSHAHSVWISALLGNLGIAVAIVGWQVTVVASVALRWCLAVDVLVLGVNVLRIGYSDCRHDDQ